MRTNSIWVVLYYSMGLILPYAFLKQWSWGIGAALLACVVLLPLLRVRARQSSRLDAQGWTASSTKGTVGFVVMVIAWLPQMYKTGLASSVTTLFFVTVSGVILGVALYFHDYLTPIAGYPNAELHQKALDMEHREVVAFLSFSGAAMMIVFGAVFGNFAVSQLKPAPDRQTAIPLEKLGQWSILAIHSVVGFILWVLRPFHARAREIRTELKEMGVTQGSAHGQANSEATLETESLVSAAVRPEP